MIVKKYDLEYAHNGHAFLLLGHTTEVLDIVDNYNIIFFVEKQTSKGTYDSLVEVIIVLDDKQSMLFKLRYSSDK